MSKKFSSAIHRDILKISIPAILNNITVPLLGVCDTAIAGHLGSAAFLGAVSVGAMMLNVIYWLLGFLRMGTSGLTAQAYGASDSRGALIVLFRSLTIAIAISSLVILLRHPVLDFLSSMMSADYEVDRLASSYFLICVLAMPAQLSVMSLNGWFVGLQNTLYPMIVAISINIINIILSITLVFAVGMGFTGIAYGTLIANWIGVFLSIIFAIRIYNRLPAKGNWNLISLMKNEVLKGSGLAKYFNVNSDLFLRSACVMAVTFTVTAIGARIGELTLAVNAVMMQFFTLFSYFMDGFAFSGEALCGRFKGAADIVSLKSTVKALLKWGSAMALIFFLSYLCLLSPITSLLTDNADVVKGVLKYRFWIYILPPLTVAAFICDGIFIGVTLTRRMLVSTLLASLVFYAILALPSIIAGKAILPSNSLLWTAFEVYLLCRGIFLMFQMKSVYKV